MFQLHLAYESHAPPSGRELAARMKMPLLIALVCMLIYNANGRLIATGDTYPARYLPFALLKHQTVYLDPVATVTAQGHGDRAFWMVHREDGRILSLYPLVVPLLGSPLYIPAIVYLALSEAGDCYRECNTSRDELLFRCGHASFFRPDPYQVHTVTIRTARATPSAAIFAPRLEIAAVSDWNPMFCAVHGVALALLFVVTTVLRLVFTRRVPAHGRARFFTLGPCTRPQKRK